MCGPRLSRLSRDIAGLVDFRPDQNGSFWLATFLPSRRFLIAVERFLAGGCSLVPQHFLIVLLALYLHPFTTCPTFFATGSCLPLLPILPLQDSCLGGLWYSGSQTEAWRFARPSVEGGHSIEV